MRIEFVDFNSELLDLSWKWLNDPEVKTLSGTPDFSKEEQKKWFSKLKGNSEYLIWGIMVDSVPVGAAGLKRITKTNACVFWYIGEKQYWGKGIGAFVASEISKKGRDLKLKYLYGEPNIENFISINLLFKEGYKISQFRGTFYTVVKEL